MQTKTSIEATCPDCRGPLSLVRIDSLVEIRCLVGHTYSPKELLHAHSEAEEQALWAAVVALHETSNLVEALSDQFPPGILERLLAQAKKKARQAEAIEEVIRDLDVFAV